MFQCEDYGVPCLQNDYDRFDDVCRSELVNVISVDEIINKSNFCMSLALDFIESTKDNCEFLNLNEHLTGLQGKMGLYHLWIEIGHCQDHDMHSLLCVYVGKGWAEGRILSHIKTKWPEEHMLYITFYECENRIAKYLEQLFLETYDFHLNKSENTGRGSLYARWDEERFTLGTEIYTMSDILASKLGCE